MYNYIAVCVVAACNIATASLTSVEVRWHALKAGFITSYISYHVMQYISLAAVA